MRTMDDWELIQAYVRDRSEAAFTALADRHLGMVYSVALRQVGDTLLAGDVAQSVFVLLARKAGSLRQGTLVSGWLFRTTRFVASRALRSELRRKRREEAASVMNSVSTSPDDADALWEQLAPHLDEAVASLSETDRAAVLLRFYEKQPLRAVGARIGLSEEAAKKRVQRAVEKLRGFYARRGLCLSAAVLAAVLAERTVQAAPAALTSAVVQAGLAGVGAGTGQLPPLAQEALRAWRWTQVKLALGLAGLALLGLLLVWNLPWSRSSAPNSEVPPSPANPSALAAGPTSVSTATAAVRTGPELLFSVQDALTGTNLPGAGIHVNYVEHGRWWRRHDLATDQHGLCRVPVPASGLGRLDVGASVNGFVQRFVTWRLPDEDTLPATYTLKLQRAVPIGGWVRDAEDKPVAGAEITVTFPGTGDSSAREHQRERLGWVWDDLVVARSDAAGRWQCCVAPGEMAGIGLAATHPDYADTGVGITETGGNGADGGSLGAKFLRAGQAVLKLGALYPVEGLVTDQTGQPLAGVTVQVGRLGQSPDARTNTDAAGRFLFPRMKPGSKPITVIAEDYAIAQAEVEIGPRTSPLRFQLVPARLWRIRVVDEQGQPVPRADVCLEDWSFVRHSVEFRRPTDAEGRLEWRSAPAGKLEFCVLKPGYRGSRNHLLPADGQEHLVTLEPAPTVTGRVTDAATGEPIPFFKVFPGYAHQSAGYDRSERRFGTNGLYFLTFKEQGAPVVCFDAEDYEPTEAQATLFSTREGVCDAKLRRLDTNQIIEGTVLLPEGGPVAGVRVALATYQHRVMLRTGRLDHGSDAQSMAYGLDAFQARTDAQGRFRFKRIPGAHTVAAVNADGVGSGSCATPGQPVRVRLQRWGRLEGAVRLSGQNAAGRRIILRNWDQERFSGAFYCVADSFTTTSDDQGGFTLPEVPPGVFYLEVETERARLGRDYAGVEVRPGEVTRVELGGTGQAVTGRFLPPAGRRVTDWSQELSTAILASELPAAQPPAGLSQDDDSRWRIPFWAANLPTFRAARACTVQVRPDGTFTVSDAPPGACELRASLRASSPTEPRAACRRQVTLAESAGAAAPCALGEIALQVEP